MRLSELIRTVTWPELAAVFPQLYEGHIRSLPGYEQMYATLLSIAPRENDMTITLEIVPRDDEFNDEPYVSVGGRNAEGSWGLDFTPFADWLGMTVDEAALATYTPAALVVHVLWEMSFYGFTDEAIDEREKQIFAPLDDEPTPNLA